MIEFAIFGGVVVQSSNIIEMNYLQVFPIIIRYEFGTQVRR